MIKSNWFSKNGVSSWLAGDKIVARRNRYLPGIRIITKDAAYEIKSAQSGFIEITDDQGNPFIESAALFCSQFEPFQMADVVHLMNLEKSCWCTIVDLMVSGCTCGHLEIIKNRGENE
jgi:hypothetical protein